MQNHTEGQRRRSPAARWQRRVPSTRTRNDVVLSRSAADPLVSLASEVSASGAVLLALTSTATLSTRQGSSNRRRLALFAAVGSKTQQLRDVRVGQMMIPPTLVQVLSADHILMMISHGYAAAAAAQPVGLSIESTPASSRPDGGSGQRERAETSKRSTDGSSTFIVPPFALRCSLAKHRQHIVSTQSTNLLLITAHLTQHSALHNALIAQRRSAIAGSACSGHLMLDTLTSLPTAACESSSSHPSRLPRST